MILFDRFLAFSYFLFVLFLKAKLKTAAFVGFMVVF